MVCHFCFGRLDAYCNHHIPRKCSSPYRKIATGIQSCTFFRTSCIPRAGSYLFFSLSDCVQSMVRTSLEKATTSTEDSYIVGIVRCFANFIIACHCTPKLSALCDIMLDISDGSLYQPEIVTGAECICSIYVSTGRFSFYIS